MADYVIQSWVARDEPASGSDASVKIVGRASGALSWLLGLMQISPVVMFLVTGEKITFEIGSLSGSLTHHTPLENLCSTFYGYTKPWKEAVAIGAAAGSPMQSAFEDR